MQKINKNEVFDRDLTVSESGIVIRNCEIKGTLTLKNVKNCLIAQSEIGGDIILENCFNCVILLCGAFNITATGCKNIYVIANRARGGITLTENEYLIADKNEFEYVMEVGNIGVNGDSVTEIYDRSECGALRRLQPHTNKDQFVGMERESEVDSLSIADYIKKEAESSDTVISKLS